jgi:hypothetical protein
MGIGRSITLIRWAGLEMDEGIFLSEGITGIV